MPMAEIVCQLWIYSKFCQLTNQMLFKEKNLWSLQKNAVFSVVLITNEKKNLLSLITHNSNMHWYIIILYIRACDLKNVYIYYKYKL